jgi:hypothetical protein
MDEKKQQLINETEMAFDLLCMKIAELHKLGVTVAVYDGLRNTLNEGFPSISITETTDHFHKFGKDAFITANKKD